MSSSRTLVTGCAGFIGSHLCDALLARVDMVIGLDDQSSGSEESVTALLCSPRFTYIPQDVREHINLTNIASIFHLACPASPLQYQRDPVRTITTNVVGTIRVLELARRCGSRVLLASTSEVYGDPLQHPQSEAYCGNVDPLSIRACYDEGKRCAETVVMDYHRQYGTDIKIARIFNTYGPRMRLDDGRVISNFIVQALEDRDLTVYGDGQQTRSFCYIADLIDALLRFMTTPPSIQGPINLGTTDEITVVALAQMVLAQTQSSNRIVHKALPQGDPVRRRPDISRAQALLGWSPTTNLASGLSRTIPWFAERVIPAGSSVSCLEDRHAPRH